jgi:hypothetical protein
MKVKFAHLRHDRSQPDSTPYEHRSRSDVSRPDRHRVRPLAGLPQNLDIRHRYGRTTHRKGLEIRAVLSRGPPDILRDHLRLSRGELTYSLASFRCRENQMVTLISMFVVDPMNQLASEKALSIAKFEPGFYEAAARTFIRLVTKRRVRRAKRAHTHSPRGIDYCAGSKRQISSTNLAPFKDWCSGIWRDSLKMSGVALVVLLAVHNRQCIDWWQVATTR